MGWIVLAITVGITLGGFNGYGIFIAWVQGRFFLTYQGTWIRLRKNENVALIRTALASKHRSAEKLVGFYLPIWLVLNLAVFNALGGVLETFELTLDLIPYMVLVGIFFIPTTILFVRAVYKTKKNHFQTGDGRENITKVPMSIFFTLVMLIGMGYAVTIPNEMTLASQVLLILYSIYISGSALLLNSFRARRPRPASVGR